MRGKREAEAEASAFSVPPVIYGDQSKRFIFVHCSSACSFLVRVARASECGGRKEGRKQEAENAREDGGGEKMMLQIND